MAGVPNHSCLMLSANFLTTFGKTKLGLSFLSHTSMAALTMFDSTYACKKTENTKTGLQSRRTDESRNKDACISVTSPHINQTVKPSSTKNHINETSECFICRDVELQASDPLRNFCDCKNLLAHHACLSTWIQRGSGSEDRLRCIICEAKYQLQRRSPWLSVSFQWQTWLVLLTALVFLCLVPYVVHCMMTAFTNPPPPSTFKVAAATFGFLTEVLLVKCVWSYIYSRYLQAEQSSFTVRPRGFEEAPSGSCCWDRC